MDMVISEMSLSMLEGFVGYWEQHLPGLSTDSTKSMNRSAIILGILALKDPKLLSDETKAAIAHSLVSQIGGDKRNLFRTAAIQMLGNGFQVWRPYFQPLPIFKALFSWLASVLDGGCHDPRMASSIQITEEALCQFIQHEKYSILPFWLGELSATKSVSERICGLGVISHILQTSPCSFREYTILILDHVTRMLEPGLPSMRTAMAPVVTPLLLEFTRAFPSVRLHRESQQLLVGGMTDGMVVIFELRTASRSHAFEGLTRGVSAVAFSPDAKQICAYSFDEATLRIWTVPSGLRTILGTVYKPVKTLVVDPTVTEVFLQLQKEFGEAGTAWLSLDWASPTAVKFSFSNGTNVIMYI